MAAEERPRGTDRPGPPGDGPGGGGGAGGEASLAGLHASPWGALGRTAVLATVAWGGKMTLDVLNRTRVHNRSRLVAAALARPPGQGLLTVSNHASTLDDPFLFTHLMPWAFYLTEHQHGRTRWALCAKDVCFKHDLLAQFFLSGKTLPVVRGGGIGQEIMQVAAERLASGDWLHVFPEGGIPTHFEGRTMEGTRLGRMRWGAAKLICDNANRPPVVLPFFHRGMEAVQPKGSVFPKPGHGVTMTVGEPLELADLLHACKRTAGKKGEEGRKEQEGVYIQIMDRIEASLRGLEPQCNADFARDWGRSPPP